MPHLKEIISVCVCVCERERERVKKNKRDFFFSHETYTRIIVINLIIMKLFRVCSVIFPFKKKGFSK